jgi:hypothetical protein
MGENKDKEFKREIRYYESIKRKIIRQMILMKKINSLYLNSN